MPESSDGHSKQLTLDRFCDRYLAFWMFSCMAAAVFVGWGAIVAWIGLAMAMNAFRNGLRDKS